MGQNKVIVTADRPDDHDDQLQDVLDKSAAIAAGSTGISTTAWLTARTAAQVAQTAVSSGAPGAANTRNEKFQLMFLEEDKVIRELQDLVDAPALPIEAKIALSLSNGFGVRDLGVINKSDFKVYDMTTSGSVKFVAKGSQEDSFHEWGFSTDNGVTWQYIEPTFRATKIVDGLTIGVNTKFRHRIHFRKSVSEWHYDELIVR